MVVLAAVLTTCLAAEFSQVQTKKIREDYKLYLYTIEIGSLFLNKTN